MQENTQILTEVTSIADQEQKTGVKVDLPSADELVRRAIGNFHTNIRRFNGVFKNLSARSKGRVMNAVLDLPLNVEAVPVLLKSEEEKLAFGLGQRIIADRFIITYHHIIEERRKLLDNNSKVSDTSSVVTDSTNSSKETVND